MFFQTPKCGEKQKAGLTKRVKSFIIGIFGVAVFVTLITSGLIAFKKADSADTTSAPVPQFNFTQGDYEMLTGAKYGQSGWVDPVSNINVGEEVAVAFYLHNGVPDSVAHSTHVRVDLNGNIVNNISMTSHLWSQETTDITDTIVNNQIVGRSGLTINLANGAVGRAEFVSGTTRLYKNQDGQFVYDRDLPDGITQNSGLNLGDINGCWNYAKFITFRVKIKGVTSFKMDKMVRISPSTTWQQTAEAWAGDTVEYEVAVENTGTEPATVVLKDLKPDYMTYISGSTYYADYLHPAPGVKMPDTLFTSSGITLTNVPVDNLSTPNQDEGVVYIIYKMKIDDTLPGMTAGTCSAGYVMNNVAKLYLNGAEIWSDTASVLTRCHQIAMSLLKQVKTGANTWGKSNIALLGNYVDYRITLKNDGNTSITNVKVRDIIPQYSNYVVGSTKVDGVAANDQIITDSGLNIGTLTPAQQKIVTLQILMYGCVPLGNYTLTNTAYGWADNYNQLHDSATTTVNVSAPNLY